MWAPLRKEISEICERLDIPDERFKPISLLEWNTVKGKIFAKFLSSDDGWIWENLKGPSSSVQFHDKDPLDQLLGLINPHEKVWLFLDETISEHKKYWFYEGYRPEIVSILQESTLLREVYLASNKYDWLLCLNHHGYIIAAGDEMSGKLIKLESND